MMPVSSASSPVDTAGSDRHDDPHQVRDISMDWPARLLDQRAGPKGTGYVVQYLGVELLRAEPGALVLLDDLRQKGWREIGPIVVCRAARDLGVGVGARVVRIGISRSIAQR